MSDLLRYPLNSLLSFHYFAKSDIADLSAGGLRLIADSGAYSAGSLGVSVDIGAFADWAKRWDGCFSWVASLDAIGDAEGTWQNYRTLRDRYGLDVVPTVHYGAKPEALDRYAAEGVDFVGLGGMVPRKSQPKLLLRWCLAMMRYARDQHPTMRFHGWGVTHRMLVEALPWYSVDSSGGGSSYRYGRATIYDPSSNSQVSMAMNARDAHRHALLLRRHYGIRAADVEESLPTSRRALIRLAARSYQLREDFLRAKFQVPAPTYGVRDAIAGPCVHVAESAINNLHHLKDPTA